ncbi:MAG: hypothetical protein EOM52_10585 [Clostridia bacterium]|nr:hypothetical protein [Clostridia bacterium]
MNWKTGGVFFLASFLGAIAETVFMLVTRGVLQNRSGVLWGPFSLVWGLGAVLFTVAFHRFAGKSGAWVFLCGAVMGGVYEYFCSWFQERIFGACFWDYSHLPLNINGRVSVFHCLFWGLAALVWVELLYPVLCALLARLPNRHGRELTWVLTLFMVCNMTVSAAALDRMDERQLGMPASGVIERFLDRRYPDEKLQKIYSNLVYIGTDEAKEAAGVGTPSTR